MTNSLAAATRRDRTAARAPAAAWLALLAGPLSFGIAGPALILSDAAAGLGVSVAAATWIVTAFGLGIAVGTPLTGGLIGHRGARTALAGSALLVLLGSVLAATVPLLPVLAAASAIQGLGAAGLTTTAMSLAGSTRVMGLITAALAVFGATAPLVGSLVSDALSWHVALALPGLSLLAVPASLRRAPGHRGRPATVPPVHGRFDGRGAVLLTALVTALVFVPQWPVVAGPCAIVAGALLGLHVRRRPDGLVPTVVIRTPRFLISAGLVFALAVVNFGMFYGVPVLLSRHAGWTASAIGFAMLWPLLFGGLASWVVVTATTRLRFGTVVAAFAAAGVAAALTAISSVAPLVLLAAPAISSVTAAAGQGVFAVRATAAVPGDRRPAAIGLFNLCYLLGAAFGPAMVGQLLA
jgi:MFS transporter, DHA2 family, metal-tetracycline-proton antiporter